MIDLMINDPDAVCQAKYSGHKPADGGRALPEVKHAGPPSGNGSKSFLTNRALHRQDGVGAFFWCPKNVQQC